MPTTIEAVTTVPRTGPHWSHTYISETIRDASQFDSLEIHGMVNIDEDYSEVDDDTPEFFSLFVHHMYGDGQQCIGDFCNLDDAARLGSNISDLCGWPLTVSCADYDNSEYELPLAS